MSKFKVGDRVRVIGPVRSAVELRGEWEVEDLLVGQVGTNTTEQYRGPLVKIDGYWFGSDAVELVSDTPTNTLTQGQTYTSANGNKWECIFVRDGKAWCVGVHDGKAEGSAYDFDIDGTASWAIECNRDVYNIVFDPERETVTRYVTYVDYGGAKSGFYHELGGYGGKTATTLAITFDLINGTPNWSTAKVTPCA